MVLPKLAFIMD